jgi:glutaredoxin 3
LRPGLRTQRHGDYRIMKWPNVRRWLSVARGPTAPEPQVGKSSPAMYQPSRVRLFIKPHCGWCTHAMEWLDDRAIQYETLDVISNDAAYEEMYRLSGQTLAPVIEVDGKVLADFGARELASFWKTLSCEINPPEESGVPRKE